MRHEFTETPRRKVAVSGGMDPLHAGHVRMIQDAAKYGDVYIILNTDSWLIRKKGFCFMQWDQRAEILRAIKGVKDVILAKDDDGTVCETLRYLYPDYFANGGDRKKDNTPELKMCYELDIIPLFGVGGDKVASSSELVNAIR